MNERIRLLAEEAGLVKILDEHASEYGNGMFENTPYPELEKFAKLIVQGCIFQIEQDRFQKAEEAENTGDPYDDGYVYGMRRAECILKEHFEVEE